MIISRPIGLLLSLCFALCLTMTAAAQEDTDTLSAALNGAQWQFVASTDSGIETLALPEETITLAFDETAITGSSGCNSYNGTYTRIDDYTITVGPLASTRMACISDELNQQEHFYLEALQNTSSIAWSGDVLTIRDNAGHSLIFLRIIPLEEAEWQLTSYGPLGAETPVIAATVVTLGFENGNASGTAGCNSYGSPYTLDAAASTLTFDGLVISEMGCMAEGVMEQEAAFAAILQAATRYEMHGNRLTILTADDQALQFTRLPALENTLWQLVAFGDENAPTPAIEGHPVTLTLAEERGEADGKSGCNYYGGPYTLNIEAGTLTFQDVFTTLMACLEEGVMEQESAYTEALRTVTHYTLSGDTLTLFYGEGQALVYRPAYQAAPLADSNQ